MSLFHVSFFNKPVEHSVKDSMHTHILISTKKIPMELKRIDSMHTTNLDYSLAYTIESIKMLNQHIAVRYIDTYMYVTIVWLSATHSHCLTKLIFNLVLWPLCSLKIEFLQFIGSQLVWNEKFCFKLNMHVSWKYVYNEAKTFIYTPHNNTTKCFALILLCWNLFGLHTSAWICVS